MREEVFKFFFYLDRKIIFEPFKFLTTATNKFNYFLLKPSIFQNALTSQSATILDALHLRPLCEPDLSGTALA